MSTKRILLFFSCLIGVGALSAQTYTLRVFADGCNTPVEYQDLQSGDQVEVLVTPDVTYRFTHWNDGNTDNPRTFTVTEDTEYTAYFAYDRYILTIYSDGCETPNIVQDIAAGEQVKITAVPSGQDRFAHWQDGNTDNPRIVTVTEDVTYTAYYEYDHYTYDRFTIKFYPEGCEEDSSVYRDMAYDNQISVLAVANDNHHFVHWQDGNTDNPRIITVAGEATYVASYAPDQHTLTWDMDGGETESDESAYSHGLVTYNTSIVAPADPTKEGYTFIGWSPAVSDIMPDQDVTYTAQWEEYIQVHVIPDAAQGGQSLLEAQTAVSAQLTHLLNRTVTVQIDRTIYCDGYYNTLCLPFDIPQAMWMDEEANPLYGGQLMHYQGATITGEGKIELTIEATDHIEAGKPYLISFLAGEDIVAPVFSGVTITTATPLTDALEGMSFHATFTPRQLEAGNQNILFVGANNKLYWPSANALKQNPLKGFRAYFTINQVSNIGPRIRRGAAAELVTRRPVTTDMDCVNAVETQISKRIENGHLVIYRNGKDYDAVGRLIK